jgi:nucleotide-binding universal stress UspA family protein
MPMYDKILVPVDGSPTSTRGLDEAARLAQALRSKVKLIHIVNELILDGGQATWGYDKLVEGLREGGRRILDDAIAYAKKQGIKDPDSQLFEVIGGRAAHVVVDEARRWGADLIVMGTHGRRGISRLAMGSDAELVLRHAPVPVLVVAPDR